MIPRVAFCSERADCIFVYGGAVFEFFPGEIHFRRFHPRDTYFLASPLMNAHEYARGERLLNLLASRREVRKRRIALPRAKTRKGLGESGSTVRRDAERVRRRLVAINLKYASRLSSGFTLLPWQRKIRIDPLIKSVNRRYVQPLYAEPGRLP